MAGVLTSGMMAGARLAGMKVGKKLMTLAQAHYLWEALILVQ